MAQDSSLRERLLAYSFRLRELNLYLDTHPTDIYALREFKESRNEFERLKSEYGSKGGVWFVTDADCNRRFEWIDSPWPWEYREEV